MSRTDLRSERPQRIPVHGLQVETRDSIVMAGLTIGRDPDDARSLVYRAHDSASVREWEPFAAATSDMEFVLGCCDRLFHLGVAASGGDPIVERALWDAALVALFKHYCPGVKRSVRTAIDEFLSSCPEKDRQAFQEWATERNRRVAHPVGFREQYRAAVGLDDDGNPVVFHGIRVLALRPDNAAIGWVQRLVSGLKRHLESRRDELMAKIGPELDALPSAALQALPALQFAPLGLKRAPGNPMRLRKPPSGGRTDNT